MKKLLTLLMLGLFSCAIIGCEASAGVDDNDDRDTYRKQTTTIDPDGDRRTKTTVRESEID